MPLAHLTLRTNGVALHAVADGPDDGPLALLLHGFPEGWLGWRRQLPALAAAGYRAVAIDGRGYGGSAKPAAIGAYALPELGRDALGVLDALGRERACVAGHDWGAAVAWWLALAHPERLERLAILNVPHPAVMMRRLRRDPRQLRRSWYVFALQLPLLPEWAARRGDYRLLRRALVATSRPGTFTEADLAAYRDAWARPGALRGMIDPYRALLRHPARPPGGGRVRVPTLLAWGARDAFLGVEMAEESLAWCDDGRLELLEDATHWLQHEEPERVSALLIEHFGGARSP